MENYPLVLKADPARQQAAEKAWQGFLKQYDLPEVEPDFEPILYTPKELPKNLQSLIDLSPQNSSLDETQAKEVLRNFISDARTVICGDFYDTQIELDDITFENLVTAGKTYIVRYKQSSYPFPVVSGSKTGENYGTLTFILRDDGGLFDLRSQLIPLLDLPTQGSTDLEALINKLIGREFYYSEIAGDESVYKVSGREEIEEIKNDNLVIYLKLEDDSLRFHLAYKIGVGEDPELWSWTVYCDAITGEELSETQNFNT